MRNTILMALAMCLAAPLALAQADLHPQYISDDVTVSLRDQPGTDAPTRGTVRSGDRVSVLQSEGAGSYARVRTADGREGWIPERYLASSPAARDRLDALQKQLGDAQAQIQAQKAQLDTAHEQLGQVKPSLELAAQNEQLRAKLEESERQLATARSRNDAEMERRQTLLAGGGLIGAGILLGLLLPWVFKPRRRRYSDF